MIYGAIPPILNRLQAYPLFGSKTDIIPLVSGEKFSDNVLIIKHQ